MNNNKDNSTFKHIVGIGASAGGLEALQKFLTALSPDTGFPFVIVQHLSPNYKSLLGEILEKNTEMPVLLAEDGMKLKANYVYVIQPGVNMRLENGRLKLTAKIPKKLNLPIDIFFQSLAEEAGSRAIAIILSGTGSDGTNGIRAIKENDGMVIVQDLSSSKFDGMPRSAMRTGLVDAQISPEEIALELQHISNAGPDPIQVKKEMEIDSGLMEKIYLILKIVSSIDFTHYKQATLIRRIERRMTFTHKNNLLDYVNYLNATPEEVRILYKELLIGVTNFFRDPTLFQCLKEKVIAEIVERSTSSEPIRVWVAGCSTGEEAYSIAILFSEVMEAAKVKREIKIFATDLDAEAIAAAGKGVFSDSIADCVSADRLNRYFTRRNNTFTVNRDIRKMVIFSLHNVFQDPPFGRLDLISCRNMMIYFQPVLQNDLFAIFHQALKDGGFLFLGKSEAIGIYTEAFPVVDAAAKIFSHRSGMRIVGTKNLPYYRATYLNDDGMSDCEVGFPRPAAQGEIGYNEEMSIDNKLLEQFMPACLVVNDNNELIHTYGDCNNYIHLSKGKFSNDLFDVITEALKIPTSTLLKEARETKAKIQYRDIHLIGERKNTLIDLTVLPISKDNGNNEGLYALIFSESGQHESSASIIYDIDKVASKRISDLEQECSKLKAQLVRSMSDQNTVNEELQAANEELLTANEELQSSNEELQSVNEELYTVNTEYQQRLSELADLNDDIANFLASTSTGIIFVDNQLNIRRYTDYVMSEFSVIDHDIGRSLALISHFFIQTDIIEICKTVLRTLIPDEREVTTINDKTYYMRVAPYRSVENKIMGCVVTLMDITLQKQEQVILQDTEEQLLIARQESNAKKEYLSRIAREISTPLDSITGLSKAAKYQTDNKEVLFTSMDKITDTVDYITEIIMNVLEKSVNEDFADEPENDGQ